MLANLILLATLGQAAQKAEDPRDAKIAKALKMPTNVEFINTPLDDVADYLGDLHGIKVEIDAKALDKAKVGIDAPITKKATDVPLGIILGEILEPLKLDYIVKDHVLTITSAEEAKEWKKRNDKK